MKSHDGQLLSENVIPYSHSLFLVRDSDASPVLKTDWKPDSAPIAANSTSAAVTTVTDALRLIARFYRGPEGCMSHLGRGSASVFKIRVPSGRLVVQQIIDGDLEKHPLAFDVSWIGGGWIHIVVVQQKPKDSYSNDLPVWIHFLSEEEHAAQASQLPPVIATNFPEPGASTVQPKRTPFQPQTLLGRFLMWGWKKMR